MHWKGASQVKLFNTPEVTSSTDPRASLPPLDLDLIRQMFRSGTSIENLSKQFQATKTNIEAVIGREFLVDRENASIRIMYKAGMTMEKIAEQVGLSVSSVRRRIPSNERRGTGRRG